MRLDILAVETLCHLIAPTTMEFELTIRMRTVSQWERTDWHALDAALSLVTKWLGGRYRPVAIFAAPFLGDKQLYYPDTELPKTSDLGVFILRTTSNEKAGWA
ncbi:hypothetical protein OBBRIDRAFT_840226 [Obba rivulosa]|uniref:Uncharacterized protein n=1 Tax=Obba rivulosa TaxID=1052685 RepID=A0A8E2AG55_9APHY|nr:hypothetical protein OBBRIDRAFT_840226 [Obba rivulosa]